TAPRENRDYSSYLFASEMASVQVKYRYGASVDDILAYPDIGHQFDELAKRLQPGYTPLEYRLAALHIRKSQYIEKDERARYYRLRAREAEQVAQVIGPLSGLNVQKLVPSDAIVGLLEKTDSPRFLYISQAKSLPDAVRPFTRQDTFDALANAFWTPSLST